nr:unnamed protein product [Callosobruchus chinensis]
MATEQQDTAAGAASYDDSDLLKTLIKKRGSVKFRLTHLKKYLDKIESDGTVLNELELTQLQLKADRMPRLFDEFAEIQCQIECLSDKVEQFEERVEFENAHDLSVARIKSLLGNLDDSKKSVKSDASNESIVSGQSVRSSIQSKFSSLNYINAYKALNERYNNEKVLIHNHIQGIFNIEKINKESSAELRRVVDALSKHLRAIVQLGQKIDNWDCLIIFMTTSKLIKAANQEWEKHSKKIKEPTIEEFREFLIERADFLQTMESKEMKSQEKLSDKFDKNNGSVRSGHTCSVFVKLNINERIDRAKQLRLCLNCLKPGHFSRICRASTCKKCNYKHHVLLHIEKARHQPATAQNTDHEVSRSAHETEGQQSISNSSEGAGNSVALSAYSSRNYGLLSTALVRVVGTNGKSFIVRAVLDSGSQSSYLIADLCDTLGIQKEKMNLTVEGINNTVSQIKFKCSVELQSLSHDYKKVIDCLVVPEITGLIPSVPVDISKIKIPQNIALADPNFNVPSKISLLIGVNLFYELLCIGQTKLGPGMPILQRTRLGWIVSGNVPNDAVLGYKKTYCNFSVNNEIEQQLTRFWEIEELSHSNPLSYEEKLCEQHFSATTVRNDEGRFIVSIPFKDDIEKLGSSREHAEKRFFNLENKLESNSQLKERYKEFIVEYQSLGHMTRIENTDCEKIAYYMPHHGVLRENSLTTKLRVVFDASAPSTSGYSLNNLQMLGPTVQNDLISIILRFRTYSFVLCGDIEKMYRQILINPEQQSLQRILWRDNHSLPLNTYELKTVTYGTKSAPYLATRCIKELAILHEKSDPEASEIIMNCFYVDDMLMGANNLKDAVQLGKRVFDILKSAGFTLRKWSSNNDEILHEMDVTTSNNDSILINDMECFKALGLTWNKRNDTFNFEVSICGNDQKVTKRLILSIISQLFDPMGLISPCVIIGKVLIQKLWLEKIDWDSPVSEELKIEWLKLRNNLAELNKLKIDRQVVCNEAVKIELHGFSDASAEAYGAAVYVRSVDINGKIHVCLLCAKSRVAPLKTISIPRLELCGAVILAKLVDKVINSCKIDFDKVYCWTDSTVVLGWLKTIPNLLKTFVANRVSEIQTLESQNCCQWRHVPTKSNPADILSRGMYPNELGMNRLWWKGPMFLLNEESDWPEIKQKSCNLPEVKEKSNTLFAFSTGSFPFDNFSSLMRIKRVVAYMLRFAKNAANNENQIKGLLTLDEIENGFLCLIRCAQRECFSQEISDLLSKNKISKKSKLLMLNPFLDENNVLRVGGRLENSMYSYDKKHPIILSSKHHLSKLIFEREHLKFYHIGPQALLASTREKFWVIGGKSLAKYVIKKCITCFRHNAKILNPIMGNLPKARFDGQYPFEITGIDYGGPLLIKDKKGRGAKLTKCYICLFVCFLHKSCSY